MCSQGGICRGKPGNFPLTGSDLPSHWFVWKLRGNGKGEGREREGWRRPLALLPPPTGFCLKYHPVCSVYVLFFIYCFVSGLTTVFSLADCNVPIVVFVVLSYYGYIKYMYIKYICAMHFRVVNLVAYKLGKVGMYWEAHIYALAYSWGNVLSTEGMSGD